MCNAPQDGADLEMARRTHNTPLHLQDDNQAPEAYFAKVGGGHIVEFKSCNLGLLSERLRLSASWEPLGGSPEPPQLGPDIGGSGGSHRVAYP